jgi:hypothetical protein
MDEGKKLPLTVGKDIVGTATLFSNEQIDVELDLNLCRFHGHYDMLVAGTLNNLSIEESFISEIKE